MSPEVIWTTIVLIGLLVLYYRQVYSDHIVFGGHFMEQEQDGKTTLLLRTLAKKPISDVLPKNIFFRGALMYAIWQRCSENQPFIIMSEKDMGVLMPAITNVISELSQGGIIDRMRERPTTSVQMYFAVTFEKHGWVLSRKIRVIILTEKQLQRLVDQGTDGLHVQSPHHEARKRTLALIAKKWSEENRSQPDMRLVHPVELTCSE